MYVEILCNLIYCYNKSLKLFMVKFSVFGLLVICIKNIKFMWEKWGV